MNLCPICQGTLDSCELCEAAGMAGPNPPEGYLYTQEAVRAELWRRLRVMLQRGVDSADYCPKCERAVVRLLSHAEAAHPELLADARKSLLQSHD